jgi:outer membrane lipoprotein LolB
MLFLRPAANPILSAVARPHTNLLLLAIVFLTILSGCTSTPTAPDKPLPHLLKAWEIQGKIGYRSSQGNGSALLYWRQKNSLYHLNLSGPFGSGNVNINGDLTQAFISEGQDHARSVEVGTLSQTLGFDVPLEQLQYWIQGRTAPHNPVTKLTNKHNKTESFEQNGWSVSYRRYSSVKGRDLPTKIVIEQDQAKLTLIIKSWTI